MDDLINNLNNIPITKKNLKEIDYFVPNFEICKCIKVYDGDSITVIAYLFNNIKPYKFTLRIDGVDTPEIRSKNWKEKQFAKIVRDNLQEKILNKIIKVKIHKKDKYGRLLATIYENIDNPGEDDKKIESINEWLVKNKYAKRYFGGTKEKWFDEED